MKCILKISIFVFLITLSSNLKAEKGLMNSWYQIVCEKVDPNLNDDEALFTFHFDGVDQTGQYENKIRFSSNGVEKCIVPDSLNNFQLKAKPGKYKFQLFYNYDFYELTTDSIEIKNRYRTDINIHFIRSEKYIICDKPVIYAYSDNQDQVSIRLDLKGELMFTYPLIGDQWEFATNSNGDIILDGQQYPYLFWEGETKLNQSTTNWQDGFIVKKEELIHFFEDKLSIMGFTAKEKTDFITYWGPLMSKYESTYIHFLFNDDFEKYALLTITPKPDCLMRLFMVWEPIENGVILNLKEQEFPVIKRGGLTIIEWGGAKLNSVNQTSL